jgi:hypothetical protein
VRKPYSTVSLAAVLRGGAAAVLVLAGAMLAACETELTPPFIVEGAGSIEGRVFFDAAGTGRYDPGSGDFALANRRVELRERGTERVMAGGETTTDARGIFQFTNVPPGTHHVFVDTLGLVEMSICRNPIPVSVYINETQAVTVPTPRGCVITVRTAKEQPLGTFVMVEGVVTVGQGRHRPDNIYVQDLTAGIQVFGVSGALGLVEGDSVRVMGDMGAFNDELQIVQPSVTHLGDATPIEPRLLTGAQVNSLAHVGELVTVRNAMVRSVGNPDGLGRHNVSLEAPDGQTFEVRIEGGMVPHMAHSDWELGARYHIVGALGNFRGMAQVKPRIATDIVKVQ